MLLKNTDRIIEIMMPYGDSLKSLAEWYVQLLAESLGKHQPKTDGRYGRTPVVAVGTTDMHAQTQEHQEGRLNKIVSFVKVKDWETKAIVPHTYDEYKPLKACKIVPNASIKVLTVTQRNCPPCTCVYTNFETS